MSYKFHDSFLFEKKKKKKKKRKKKKANTPEYIHDVKS